jgi:hypothetical protein
MDCAALAHTVAPVTLAALVCIVVVFARVYPSLEDGVARRKALASVIRTVFAVTWPLVLTRVLVPSHDCASCLLCAPIVWVGLMWCIDSYLMHYTTSKTEDAPASLRLDPVSVTGLTFGLCNLAGARPDGTYTDLFMSAILGALLVVLPSHNMQPDCVEAQVFESVQKAALTWCIGALFAAVVLTRSATRCTSGATADAGAAQR